MVDSNPADCLEGRDLGNGWTVESKITRKPNSTGGCFSVGYKVKRTDGKIAFLKALDFSEALRAHDPAIALQSVTQQFNFERAILEKCRDRKLHRILTPLTDGKITIAGFGPLGVVHYLIFELAKGDIRNVLSDFRSLDLLWCLTSLHHVSVGLQQLHTNGTAHQDLKPSNVLFMEGDGSKISDLGRASDQNMQSPFDSASVPGDFGYAAPDLYYKDTKVDGFEKRLLADLYLLGSLIFFHFSGLSAVQALRNKLLGVTLACTNFQQDLPYLQHAFEETLIDLRIEMVKVAGNLADPIMVLARQLCEPDPLRRGDPQWKDSVVPRHNLQRYVSALDLLCKKAECMR